MYSELEALNFLLSHVGAAPVTTTNNPLPDLASAQLRLYESSVWVQKRGWWFNRIWYQDYVPDEETNEIDLPTNTLKILSAFPEFVIEKDGKVSAVKIKRGVDPLLDKEAVRVVKSMPKWKPGKQRVKPVRLQYLVPLNFKLS